MCRNFFFLNRMEYTRATKTILYTLLKYVHMNKCSRKRASIQNIAITNPMRYHYTTQFHVHKLTRCAFTMLASRYVSQNSSSQHFKRTAHKFDSQMNRSNKKTSPFVGTSYNSLSYIVCRSIGWPIKTSIGKNLKGY